MRLISDVPCARNVIDIHHISKISEFNQTNLIRTKYNHHLFENIKNTDIGQISLKAYALTKNEFIQIYQKHFKALNQQWANGSFQLIYDMFPTDFNVIWYLDCNYIFNKHRHISLLAYTAYTPRDIEAPKYMHVHML